jgi:Zn-dependent peptidase ImmA (M78 family)/transcriptional regulator with XRE-family HTH domain
MTQDGLAGRLGIDRSALARIENGGRQVTALELFALAEALRLPLGHFVSTSPAAIASHRQDLAEDADDISRTTFRLDALMEAHARDAEWLRGRGYLDVDAVVLPETLRMGQDGATSDDARRSAVDVRRALNLEGPIESMADALASVGLFLLVVPDVSGGASLILDERFGVAVVGASDDPGRRRMTAAHELGHFILQDEYRTDLGVAASRDARAQRIEAFAAEFLLPGSVVEERWEAAREPERARLVKLSADYRVSWSASVNTVRRLGLVTAEIAGRLKATTPTRGEIIEVAGRVPTEDLLTGETAAPWRQAVITAWRGGAITAARAVELVHEAVTEADLPDREASDAS